MIDPRDRTIDAVLLAAYDPATEQPEPVRSRGLNRALDRLNEQTELLLQDLQIEAPFHLTLQQIIERM